MNDYQTPSKKVSLAQLFTAFLLIGATSFGGSVIAYLRASLVGKHQWISDADFVSFLAISQSLPGLNSTNMTLLVGDNLRGSPGAIVAMLGICLPGAIIMFAIGMLYSLHGNHPVTLALLHGASLAAVGLIFATGVQLSHKTLDRLSDLVFVLLAVLGVNVLHLSVLYVLLATGALAIWWHRPRPENNTDEAKESVKS
jgi:chromate transporter